MARYRGTLMPHLVRISNSIVLLAIVHMRQENQERFSLYTICLDKAANALRKPFAFGWSTLFLFITEIIVTRNECISLQKTNVVYELQCNTGWCKHLNCSHVGVTETTLCRRLTVHKASGAPKTHYHQVHDLPLTKKDLKKNTKTLRRENESHMLCIIEALMTRLRNSFLNLNQV